MKKLRLAIFLLTMLTPNLGQLYAYEVKTHMEITEHAFSEALEKRDFLEDIGFSSKENEIEAKDIYCDPEDPIDVCIDVSKSILDWVKHGSNVEDATIGGGGDAWFRYKNHFYDPHMNRGLDCPDCKPSAEGMKANDWALESNGEILKQRYSIKDAKKYYKTGLIAKSKDERDFYLAKTFRALGHVVHLVQDMAQPQHTRNDSHGGFFGFASGPQWLGDKSQYEEHIKNNMPEVTDLYLPSFTSYSAFFHTEEGKGLADFSNSNFVSAGTNFWNCGLDDNLDFCTGSNYPEPKLDFSNKSEPLFVNLSAVDESLDPTREAKVTFFKNTFTDKYSNETITNEKLTAYSIFDKDLKERKKEPAFTLNRFNYDEMSNILIPRAVGYSAGLLNHFFRGEIDMKKDESDDSKYVIENHSNEAMKGTFSLYYDDKAGERKFIQKWDIAEDIKPCEARDDAGKCTEPGEKRVKAFDVPDDAEKKGKYILVFKGTLGNESEAVVGKVVNIIDIGPYVKITEIKWLGGSKWHITFSLEGNDKSIIVEVPASKNDITYSLPTIKNTVLDKITGLILRWKLSTGKNVDSRNPYYNHFNNSLPRARKYYFNVNDYNNKTTSVNINGKEIRVSVRAIKKGWCSYNEEERYESGELYTTLTTEKRFYLLKNTSSFVGRDRVDHYKWNKKLISAFGFTAEEISNLSSSYRKAYEEGGFYKSEASSGYSGHSVSIKYVERNVVIGKYEIKDMCSREYTFYDLVDPIPFVDFGNDEVLYDINYTGGDSNISWILKLSAD